MAKSLAALVKEAKNNDHRNIRVLQFLEAYERQESLWNPCLESYKNKTARDEAYRQIISELNLPSLTINDIKLKVKSIRTTYKKELRILTKHKEEGKPYNPKLFWFNRANSFLKDVSLSRHKNLKVEKEPNKECKPYVIDFIAETTDGPSEHIDSIEQDVVDNSCSPFEYKANSSDIDTQSQGNMEILESTTNDNIPLANEICSKTHSSFRAQTGYISNTNTASINRESHEAHSTVSCINNSIDDECDLFCRSVAAQLRSVKDNYSRSVAKLKIQQILFEAETGHYRNSPCITIPVSQSINNM